MESQPNLKTRLSSYLTELEMLQARLKETLHQRQIQLIASDWKAVHQLNEREFSAVEQLRSLIERREILLADAQSLGLQVRTLQELASQVAGPDEMLAQTAQKLKLNMDILHAASRSQWVFCQKSVLHHAQLVQLIATGGRNPMMSSTGREYHQGGAILDASV